MYPPQLEAVMAPLIPKKDGSLRDIGVTPALIRVHARARRGLCDLWEREHDCPMFDAGPGRGALDAIWRIAARAEAAADSGQKVAIVSWDLQAFLSGDPARSAAQEG